MEQGEARDLRALLWQRSCWRFTNQTLLLYHLSCEVGTWPCCSARLPPRDQLAGSLMLGPDGTEASRALEAACHTRSTSQHFPTAPPAARTSRGRIRSIPFNLELQMFQEHKIYDRKSPNRGHLDQNNRCSERVLPGKDPGILVSASFLSSPEPPLNLAGQWRELFSLVNVSKRGIKQRLGQQFPEHTSWLLVLGKMSPSGEVQTHRWNSSPRYLQLLVSISVNLPVLFDQILVDLIFHHLGGPRRPQALGDRGVHGL